MIAPHEMPEPPVLRSDDASLSVEHPDPFPPVHRSPKFDSGHRCPEDSVILPGAIQADPQPETILFIRAKVKFFYPKKIRRLDDA